MLAVVVLALSACGDDASSGSSFSANGEAEASAVEGLGWQDCGPGSVCTVFDVPLDHDEPDGEQLSLRIVRAPATGEREGALFVNPGGPGGDVGDMPAAVAARLPDPVTERFDVVAVDPRGMGEDLLSCGYDWAELYAPDPTVESDGDEDELLDVSQEYVDACLSAAGEDRLANMGTRDVARDMDLAREALGDEQVNFLGYSYGTAIGQVYADLFPDRVRAMVLDGVVELGSTGMESAVTQAEGFEVALEAFAADCDGDPSCPLAPDTIGAVQDLIEAVEDEPIEGGNRPLGPGELALGLAMPLYSDFMWPSLAAGIDDALGHDGAAMLALADQYMSIANFDVYFAVKCVDFEWPDDAAQHLEEAAASADTAPHFGEALVNDYVRCPLWPVDADPLEPVTAEGAPPIVVVSITNDPATPYQSGVNVAERLESGVLMTFEGDQHGVVGEGVECIDAAITSYLVDLEVPEDGTVC